MIYSTRVNKPIYTTNRDHGALVLRAHLHPPVFRRTRRPMLSTHCERGDIAENAQMIANGSITADELCVKDPACTLAHTIDWKSSPVDRLFVCL